jgi:DNA repair protein RadC
MKLVLKVLEGGRRAYLNPSKAEGHILDHRQVAMFMRRIVRREKREVFCVFLLDNRNRIYRADVVSLGTVNGTLVHPREVFSSAIQHRATAIICSHNHPSGTIEPSQDDIELTCRLAEAGKIVGIELLDHVIIAGRQAYSFREHGLVCVRR